MKHRSEDFEEWIKRTEMPESRRSIAMGFVAACRQIEDRREHKEAVTPDDFIALVVAQGTMLMETYLEPKILKTDVLEIVQASVTAHADACEKKSMSGTFQIDEAKVPSKYRGLVIAAKYLGMNSGFIAFLLFFHEPLTKLIESLATR
jgi:hypothetical protein